MNYRTSHQRRVSALAVSVLFLNLVACTEYTPVRGLTTATTQPEVRVSLTDQGRLDAAPKIGLRAQRIEGTLQAVTDTSLTLSVRKVTRDGGIEDTYIGEELSLAARDYDIVERSRISVPRSILAAGAVVVSAFAIARGAGDLSGGRTAGSPPTGK